MIDTVRGSSRTVTRGPATLEAGPSSTENVYSGSISSMGRCALRVVRNEAHFKEPLSRKNRGLQ